MKLFYFVLPCSLSQEFKFANSLKCNKKFIKAFQMLGSKVTFETIKQSVVSDTNKDAKLKTTQIIFWPNGHMQQQHYIIFRNYNSGL